MDMGKSIERRPSRFALTRRRAASIHRWLALIVCVFWLLQAATGILSVFHWQLEDMTVSSVWKPTNLKAIEARLHALAPAGSGKHITMVWTTAGLPDRYDVTVADPKGQNLGVRIAGDGTVLRSKDKSQDNFFDIVVDLHQTLQMGDTGSWIVGVSGILLIIGVLLGLRTAWPAGGRWRAALWPRSAKTPHAKFYGWHRAIGLVLVIPAVVLFAAGVGRVFDVGLASLIGAKAPAVSARPAIPGGRDVGFAAAASAAMRAAHARSLTMVAMPTPEDATYTIRVLVPGEIRRAYGTSTVFVDAASGAVRGVFPASSQPLPTRFVDMLYALHTGEIGGLPGRLLVLAIGFWLATMIVLGLLLWRARRRARSPAKAVRIDAGAPGASKP